jgi:POT family proton-dependent oligopeptide transporter
MGRANPDDVVSRLQSVHDLRVHAVRRDVLARQAARGSEPSTITKMSLGCFGVTASNLIKAFAALSGRQGQASWLWVLGSIAVITVGELYLSPVGLSLVTKVAPARILSMMMGVWLATNFFGGFLAGYLGSFWSRMQPTQFFLMIAAIAALAGVLIFCLPLAAQRSAAGMLYLNVMPRRAA